MPKSWKLWVSIIPIKGVGFSWEDWKTTDSGVLIATKHNNPLINVNIENVKADTSIANLFGTIDPFSPLIN